VEGFSAAPRLRPFPTGADLYIDGGPGL
jgi:hypothetical protein